MPFGYIWHKNSLTIKKTNHFWLVFFGFHLCFDTTSNFIAKADVGFDGEFRKLPYFANP